jgi:hypothetical protein
LNQRFFIHPSHPPAAEEIRELTVDHIQFTDVNGRWAVDEGANPRRFVVRRT